jgi:hypothetical protein
MIFRQSVERQSYERASIKKRAQFPAPLDVVCDRKALFRAAAMVMLRRNGRTAMTFKTSFAIVVAILMPRVMRIMAVFVTRFLTVVMGIVTCFVMPLASFLMTRFTAVMMRRRGFVVWLVTFRRLCGNCEQQPAYKGERQKGTFHNGGSKSGWMFRFS